MQVIQAFQFLFSCILKLVPTLLTLRGHSSQMIYDMKWKKNKRKRTMSSWMPWSQILWAWISQQMVSKLPTKTNWLMSGHTVKQRNEFSVYGLVSLTPCTLTSHKADLSLQTSLTCFLVYYSSSWCWFCFATCVSQFEALICSFRFLSFDSNFPCAWYFLMKLIWGMITCFSRLNIFYK